MPGILIHFQHSALIFSPFHSCSLDYESSDKKPVSVGSFALEVPDISIHYDVVILSTHKQLSLHRGPPASQKDRENISVILMVKFDKHFPSPGEKKCDV